MTMTKWKVLSETNIDKREQMKYYVKCAKCGTVRILTKAELQANDCECKQ